eukprot:9588081-Lingulodinium_polyedra.AAC.1
MAARHRITRKFRTIFATLRLATLRFASQRASCRPARAAKTCNKKLRALRMESGDLLWERA